MGGGLEKSFATPKALSEKEILEIIDRFAISATLARESGFSGVQIHGAHGYLVSQFLSPHHNRRSDQWGGTLENRMRFVLEVYRRIREKVGRSYPVGIKLNSADFMKSGFSREDSLAVALMLESEGIDMIEVSGGTYESPSMTGHRVKASTREREAYFLSYAEDLKKRVRVPVVVTGGFRSAPAMNSALASGATDMIGVARPLAVDPGFPARILADDTHALHLKNPTTGFRSLDRMTMLAITFYEYQISRIAEGKPVKVDQSAWRTVFQIFSRMGIYAFAKRRA